MYPVLVISVMVHIYLLCLMMLVVPPPPACKPADVNLIQNVSLSVYRVYYQQDLQCAFTFYIQKYSKK